jgi:hypothetical protein
MAHSQPLACNDQVLVWRLCLHGMVLHVADVDRVVNDSQDLAGHVSRSESSSKRLRANDLATGAATVAAGPKILDGPTFVPDHQEHLAARRRICTGAVFACRVEKTRLVAQQGKLVNVVEKSGIIPNGTEFAITVASAGELDETNLVVGRVVEGLDIIVELSKLPVVKDNSGSPFFKAGKAIGDKRANVAQMGFNRPFNKVAIAASGLL